MIKQIITFNGGLSTKIAPNLIPPNEATECNNVDIEEGTLKPVKDSAYAKDVTGIHNHLVDGDYISNTDTSDDRFYVEFANSLYWSDANYGSYGIMKYDGTATGVNAAPPPSPDQIAVATTAGGNLEVSIEYTYCYTFVDASYLEGTPTVFASATTSTGQQQIQVTINPTNTPTDNTQVRIYRVGGNNPTFNLVGEIDYLSTTGSVVFTDNTRDIDVTRIELTSFVDTPAPINLDMLIENNGSFWGATGDRVYFSRIGSPYFWGELDYIRLDSTCTGLGKIGSSIVAFTASDMYQIDGWHRDNVIRRKLEYNQGCKNKRTVTNVNNYLFWVSDNGVCLYDGASVVVVTKNILSWSEFARVGNQTWGDFTDERYNSGLGFEILYAKSYQDKYYGVYADGIVVVDVSNGIRASTLHESGIQSLVYNKSDNVISYIYEDKGVDSVTDIAFTSATKTISSTTTDLSIYTAGNIITVSGSTSNDGTYTVASSTATTVVVTEALVDEVAGDVISIIRLKLYTMFSSANDANAVWQTGELPDEGITIRKFYRKVNLIGELGTSNKVTVIIDGTPKLEISDRKEFFLPTGSHGYSIQFKIETNGELTGLKYEYAIGKL